MLACEELEGLPCAEVDSDGGGGHGRDVPRDPSGPLVDPFDHLYGDFNPWCGLESYRFWHNYTEYASLPGLQRFASAADLLEGLAEMAFSPAGPGRRAAALAEMRAQQARRRAETLLFWSSALLKAARTR
mmetsp:Transcript_12745/g.34478  ORF Transcript_12745/g.34478 Transcript_12745/m.34478 type:complete len:130 (+) Transcript_12745:3-392(+)